MAVGFWPLGEQEPVAMVFLELDSLFHKVMLGEFLVDVWH